MTPSMKPEIRIRDARRWHDMYQCVAIAQHATHPDDQWSLSDFSTFHRQSCSTGIAATIGDECVGYAMIESSSRQIFLAQLVVHPKYRGCGVGGRLMEGVVRKTSPDGPRLIVAEVRESDLAAQTFLRRYSFQWVETLAGAVTWTDEDCYVMKMRVGG